MTAKKKRNSRPTRTQDDRRPDIQEVLKLHIQASARRDEILEEVEQLKSAGRIRDARELLAPAETIQRYLTALERECKLLVPHRD